MGFYSTSEGCAFRVRGALPGPAYHSKPDSHDDGPEHGPFLGGLGTGTFSRDMYGRFSRWHLQPGVHLCETVPQARLISRYALSETASASSFSQSGVRYIGIGETPAWKGYRPSFGGFAGESRDYAVLFPFVQERYGEEGYPLEIELELWSPLLFEDYRAASLPVVFIEVSMRNSASIPLRGDVALFWPNLLGWRAPARTATDQGGRAWPGQHHAGNINRFFDRELQGSEFETGGSAEDLHGLGVIQGRRPEKLVRTDMEGEWAVSVAGPGRASLSSIATLKADQNAIVEPAAEQVFTQGWSEEYFAAHGVLPRQELNWRAHWHEPLSSALHAGLDLAAGEEQHVVFTLAYDMPLLVFGEGRVWEKRYTDYFGAEGRGAERINRYALARRRQWKEEIRRRTEGIVDSAFEGDAGNGGAEPGGSDAEVHIAPHLRAAALNELFFLTAGGTAWTSGQDREDLGATGSPESRKSGEVLLGEGEHFAILEGYDTGYYYYNTIDLWIYAFPAFLATWPRLAELVFEDYMKTVEIADTQRRVIYREMREKEMLGARDIPHDLGNPMEDPWIRLNGYTMRDDPNLWKDRSPSFIISFYLFKWLRGEMLGDSQWRRLLHLAEAMTGRGEQRGGLPLHGAFGDSTWDALQLRGLSIYSSGLSVAAYAALAATARHRAEDERAGRYEELLRLGVETCERELWNGSFYATDTEGSYRDCVMSDALIGPYYASLAGLGPLLPLEHIRSHLRKVYEYNFRAYRRGTVGPLLVNNGGTGRFRPDGGEELQINEVIVGSAWLYTAMLFHFGLKEEGEEVGNALRHTLYEGSGLQFRTPAAFDGEGRFRAPLNMRPLSVCWLLERAAGGLPGS